MRGADHYYVITICVVMFSVEDNANALVMH